MKEEVLKFLGRGSCFNVKEGNTAAYIKDPTGNGDLLLIDCGGTVFQKILELDLLKDVKRLYVIITHTHADHIGSLADLLYYCYYRCNIEVKIFYNCDLDEDTNNNRYIQMILNCNGTYGIYKMFNKRTLYLEETFFNINDIIIEDHCVSYNTSFKRRNNYIPSYGISIEIPFVDQKIYYSSDTKSANALEFIDTDMIDYYYYDCSIMDNDYPHINLYSLISAFKKHNIPLEKLRLMHIDCDGVLFEADQMGIKCVEVEEC